MYRIWITKDNGEKLLDVETTGFAVAYDYEGHIKAQAEGSFVKPNLLSLAIGAMGKMKG